MVIGPPGCGKTTNLCKKAAEAVAKWGGSSVLICSLTKSAAVKIKRQGLKIPAKQIGTMHSHCYHALGRPTVAELKINEWNEDNRSSGLKMNDSGHRIGESEIDNTRKSLNFGDRCYQKYTLYRAKMTPISDWSTQIQEFALLWEEWKSENDYLDFSDLIDRARLDCEYAPRRPQVIYLDEAQDSSRQELALALHWAKDANLVMTGDLDQAIFTWRGADPQAFYDLKIPKSNRKILSQSYRIPRAVHKTSVKWISQITNREPVLYRSRDFEGDVKKCPYTYKAPEKLLEFVAPYLADGKSVMFIGSCSYHLDPLVVVMRREGIPFHNPYRVKNGRWNPLARRNGTTAVDRIEAFLQPQTKGRWSLKAAARWIEVVKSDGFLVRGAKTRLKQWVSEKVSFDDEMLSSLFLDGSVAAGEAIEAAWNGNYEWLRNHLVDTKAKSLDYPICIADKHGIEALRKEPQIIVGTIHSVKGSESEVVVVFPDVSHAGITGWSAGGEGRDSIVRLFYVAMTRARETLILCAPGGPMRIEWGDIV